MRTLLRLLLALLLGALMGAVHSLDAQIPGAKAGSLTLSVGFVLACSWLAGRIAASIGLPKLTGYLATGIVTGPALLSYLDAERVREMGLVNGMATSLIALTAGSEMDFRAMRPLLRSIAWISLVGVVGTAILLAITAYLLRAHLPFLADLPLIQATWVALVLGVVLVAQSPAVVVAIRAETGANGPVSRTALGVVILADLLVIVLFAITSTATKAMLAGGFDWYATLLRLGWEIFGSFGVGTGIGVLLSLWQRHIGSRGLDLFVLATCFVSAEVGRRLHLDPLLIMLGAGLLVENIACRGEELRHAFADASLPVYILFFTVAGASIHLEAIPQVAFPALTLVLVRALGLLVGSSVGASLAQAPPSVRLYGGFGLLPQAGLAIALSLLFVRTFPSFGASASALTLSVVAINEIVAPAIFRAALIRAGEASTTGTPHPQGTSIDTNHPSPSPNQNQA
ncbi:MAG: cation:proton antiporter, partial [Sandaracinaceae bacterium]|nr:cation:proton antiporter [Sandaracinaceae bacterium]